MKNQFGLGTTVPHEEPCIQLGADDYSRFSRIEARALISQIARTIGDPPSGTSLKVISCPHDFGTYYDVAVVYDDNDETSEEYMLKVESDMPCSWDEQSIKELKEQGYPVKERHPDII